MNVPRSGLNFDPASSEATVRLKLPWHVILSGVIAMALLLVTLWASVGRLTEQVGELRAAVQASTVIMTTLQGDVILLKWRAETTDRKIDEHIQTMQARGK